MTIAPVEESVTNELRARIDEVDDEMIRLWQERAQISAEIGEARLAAGGTRLSLAREQQVIQKFQAKLGPLGAKLALLLFQAGRGTL